ncbi:MAG: cytochrome P460 family protein [Desulfarculus sp.]|nr:cytochrome P460 family protein [Desulfarculus sp.]
MLNRVRPWVWICCLAWAWQWAAACPLLAGQAPPPEAQALWKHITQPPGFYKWGTWSSLRESRRSRCATAYGYFARVFANDVALQAKGAPLPPGSIVVREGQGMGTNTYAPNGQIRAYTVMYKVRGFNPKSGDWFWASYSGTGQVRDSGALTECIKCHQTAWQNDYLLGLELK